MESLVQSAIGFQATNIYDVAASLIPYSNSSQKLIGSTMSWDDVKQCLSIVKGTPSKYTDLGAAYAIWGIGSFRFHTEGAKLEALLASYTGSAAADCPALNGWRSRGDFNTPAAVQSGDTLFRLSSRGYDGSSGFQSRSEIAFVCDGTPSAGNVPTAMQFKAGGANMPIRMTLNSSGQLGVNTTTPGCPLQVNGNTALGYNTAITPGCPLQVSGAAAIGYNTAITPTSTLQVATSAAIGYSAATNAGTSNLSVLGVIKTGAAQTQVVGARVTGFTAWTGTSNKTGLNADSGTLTIAQLAQQIKAMHDVMFAHGLIGA